jgi:hypothetical protein
MSKLWSGGMVGAGARSRSGALDADATRAAMPLGTKCARKPRTKFLRMTSRGGMACLWITLLGGGYLAVADPAPLLEWNELMLDAVRVDNTGPTLSTRNLAILNAACHDGVQSVVRTHQPYRFLLDADPDLPLEGVVASAAFEVMYHLYPTLRAWSDQLYAEQLDRLADTDVLIHALALGRDVAFRVLHARAADGSNTEVPYIPSDEPGAWRRTPPFFRPPFTPHWRYVLPFCVPDLEPFVPGPPPALDSPEYARDLNEVKLIGGVNSSIRTPEQSEIAVFWSDFSYTAMPPGHWNEIAGGIVRDRATPLADAARLLAYVSLAQADSAIACWEAKYRYNLWRPVTAIRRADEDNNPLTQPDPDWNHYLASPPFPAYTSGHSSFSRAAAQALTRFYGTDAITFTVRSDSLPGVLRSYVSLDACADEVGMSRIYGGIHYRFDNKDGQRSGRAVANYIGDHFLLPNIQLPLLRLVGIHNGEIQWRAHGRFGDSLLVESSGNLLDWQPVATLTAIPGGAPLALEPSGSVRAAFYRIRLATP